MTTLNELTRRMSELISKNLTPEAEIWLRNIACELAAAEISYLNILEADNEMLRAQIRALTEELESLDNYEMRPLC